MELVPRGRQYEVAAKIHFDFSFVRDREVTFCALASPSPPPSCSPSLHQPVQTQNTTGRPSGFTLCPFLLLAPARHRSRADRAVLRPVLRRGLQQGDVPGRG